jgi:hypothetical protein
MGRRNKYLADTSSSPECGKYCARLSLDRPARRGTLMCDVGAFAAHCCVRRHLHADRQNKAPLRAVPDAT